MRAKEKKAEPLFIVLIKGALLGVLVSVVLLLLFSICLQREWLTLARLQNVIVAAKLLSALAASLFVLLKHKGRALPVGALCGVCYALLAFVFFAILAGRFTLSWALLGDLASGALCGATAAVFLHILRA